MNLLRPFGKDNPRSHPEDGQGLVEYALILVLIAVTVISAMSMLGTNVNSVFQTIVNKLESSPIGVNSALHWSNRIYVEATYNGGTDPDVSLSVKVNGGASVNLQRHAQSGFYSHNGIPLPSGGCNPSCTVVITASPGGQTTTATTSPGN